MNKLVNLIGCILILIVLSCKGDLKTNKGYTIEGTLKNRPDSSLVKLSIDNITIDSTYLINETYKFEGSMEIPVKAYIMAIESRDFTGFWLDNSSITIEGVSGDYYNAKINGSELQDLSNLLSERLKGLRKEEDNLNKILFNDSIPKIERDQIYLTYNQNRKNQTIMTQDFVEEFPNSLVSANTLNIYKTTWGKDISSKLYNVFSDDIKKTEQGQSISRFIELYANPQIGDTYVDFSQLTTDGKTVKVSDVLGKYTLVEFWASWCGPCRASNPSLVKYYEKYKDQGFEIFGVSLDENKDNWIKAIEKDGLIWTNVSDLLGAKNEAALIYNISGIPDNLLIDENGIIIGRNLRGQAFKEQLENLFE